MSQNWELAGVQNIVKKRSWRERVVDGYHEKMPFRKNLRCTCPSNIPIFTLFELFQPIETSFGLGCRALDMDFLPMVFPPNPGTETWEMFKHFTVVAQATE